MIRAAIYIRVSTEEQSLHGLSLEAQRDALTEYAKRQNMQIVDVYADEGITARKRLDKRLQFQRLINDVKQDKIDVILVTKLDRWFRNIKDYYNTQEILEKHNCNWRTIYENYDTSTAGGRLHINIMLSVNQDECDRTSERIKAVFKHKLENGQAISGSVPYGYTIGADKRWQIDARQAEAVRDIYDQYEIAQSVSKVCKYTATRYGIKHYKIIRKMLCNTDYIGTHRGVKGFCEPIISTTQFERVQELLRKNTRAYKARGADPQLDYIFSGLIRCKECGRNMTGAKMTKVRGGQDVVYKYYRCNHAFRNHYCNNRYRPSECGILETYLLKNIKPLLAKYKAEYEITQAAVKVNDTTKEQARIRRKLDKLKDLYLDDLIDKDTYKAEYDALNSQLTQLCTVQAAPQRDLTAVRELLGMDIETIYANLLPAEKRRLWLSVIDHIDVGTNKNDIVIHFK